VNGNKLNIEFEVDPALRRQHLVPAGVVSGWMTAVISVLGVLAGAVFGAGLGGLVAPNLDAEDVQLLAAKCAADVQRCKSLELCHPINYVLLFVGFLLMLVFIAAVVVTARRKQPA
jgi:hypothetical protein